MLPSPHFKQNIATKIIFFVITVLLKQQLISHLYEPRCIDSVCVVGQFSRVQYSFTEVTFFDQYFDRI